jgi:hypothetical protein
LVIVDPPDIIDGGSEQNWRRAGLIQINHPDFGADKEVVVGLRRP